MAALETAEWIFADCDGEIKDRYFVYRDTFCVNLVKTATVHIAAHSKYALYVNKKFVDCGQYADYEEYQVYDTLDITDFLREGENELEIRQYVCGAEFFTERPAIPGVIYEVVTAQGVLTRSKSGVLAGEDYHYANLCEGINSQLSYNFEYDARSEETGFLPAVAANKEKHLYPRPIQKLDLLPLCEGKLFSQGVFLDADKTAPKAVRMQSAYLSFLEYEKLFEGVIKKPIISANPLKDYRQPSSELSWKVDEEKAGDGVYFVFDLGDEMAGFLEFSFSLPEGTEVLISFGEHLDDLRVRSAVDGRAFCFRYVAKGGRNNYFNPFHRMGLRYLQFHIYSRTGTLHYAGIRPVAYPVVVKQKQMKDHFHQKIREIGIKTLHLCMHEHYEDCPWREQSFYMMDSRNQMLCGYEVFEGLEFPRANLLLMAKSLRPDGLLEMCAPGKCFVNIPSFTAVYPRAVMEYLEHSGEDAFGKEVLPVVKAIVDGFRSRIASNGLVPNYLDKNIWNFYEWREGLDDENWAEREVLSDEAIFECPLNAFVSDAFYCMSEICRRVAPELQDTYLSLHRDMNVALHREFYDERTGAYLTRLEDTEPKHALTQGLMLYVDAVPPGYEGKVYESIKGETLIPASLSMTIYVFEGLLKRGDNRAYVLSEIDRIWGDMVWDGAKTFWETDAGADDFWRAGSLCHGWSALPIYMFNQYYPELWFSNIIGESKDEYRI